MSGLRLGSALLLAMMMCNQVMAMPARVLIIRHGEKPSNSDDNDLNARGQQRANALVGLFAAQPELTTFGLPVAIYAAAPKHNGGSLRPIETVTPLAASLDIALNKNYTKEDVDATVSEIESNPAYDGKTVLICWEHETIVDFLQSFGWQEGPSEWNHDVFDRVWELNFNASGPISFADLPQHLLPGDS